MEFENSKFKIYFLHFKILTISKNPKILIKISIFIHDLKPKTTSVKFLKKNTYLTISPFNLKSLLRSFVRSFFR